MSSKKKEHKIDTEEVVDMLHVYGWKQDKDGPFYSEKREVYKKTLTEVIQLCVIIACDE